MTESVEFRDEHPASKTIIAITIGRCQSSPRKPQDLAFISAFLLWGMQTNSACSTKINAVENATTQPEFAVAGFWTCPWRADGHGEPTVPEYIVR